MNEKEQISFYNIIAPFYRQIFPVQQPKVNFLKTHIPYKGKVLDCACGGSELPEKLAEEDYSVTALDNNPILLDLISEKMGIQVINSSFEDIGDLGLSGFDCIICIGNSLSYAGDEKELSDLLSTFKSMLKKGGVLITQTVNYDLIIRNKKTVFPEKVISRADEKLIFRREYEFIPPEKIAFRTEVVLGDKVFNNEDTFYPLKSDIQKKLLENVGFTNIFQFGGFAENPYSIDSGAIVTISEL
ncbi:MAG: methyltransferase domain-containing protein [candidate division Zixibacteria bacterium]|nr:methyltransferase domain-containing protein [candidate division Zixibacteria bacterium]